jgi:hypothetical protein
MPASMIEFLFDSIRFLCVALSIGAFVVCVPSFFYFLFAAHWTGFLEDRHEQYSRDQRTEALEELEQELSRLRHRGECAGKITLLSFCLVLGMFLLIHKVLP